MKLPGLLALLLLPLTGWAQAPAATAPAGSIVDTRVTTLAGTARQAGSTDGAGAAARFRQPRSLALAPDGMLYVADAQNHTIRRIAPTGEVTTLAGAAGRKGYADGAAALARFNYPAGLGVDAQGAVYVADPENQLIRKVSSAGVVTTLAGQAGRKGSADGAGTGALFNYPHGLAVGADGNVYVADTENHTIRRISPAGEVTTLAGSAGQKGAADGLGSAARFFNPSGIAVDPSGTLYVTDNGNHAVRKITAEGQVTTLAGQLAQRGSADGAGAAARFDWPIGIAVDAHGVVCVADNVNSTIRRISPTGEVTTLAGQVHGWGSQDGAGQDARFQFPLGIAVSADGTVIYVADTRNQLIRCIR